MKTVDDIVQLMQDAGVARGKADSLAPDQPLGEQGFDSYDWMTLLFEVEQMIDADIPTEASRKLRTLNDIVSYVNSKK